MSVQYLVDYENVHDLGLFGMNTISAEDSVYILHTSEMDRISLSLMDNMAGWVKVLLVPPGKQSLDMHLGTFLGYLIGQEQGAETRYVIISNDTDYYGIAAFWNGTYGKTDKVRCYGSITVAAEANDSDMPLSEPPAYTIDGIAMREYILKLMEDHGVLSRLGTRRILVSELCSLLQDSDAYRRERTRTGKRPMRFLLDECRDLIWISREQGQDWAYLLPGEHSYHIDDCSEHPETEDGEEQQAPSETPSTSDGNEHPAADGTTELTDRDPPQGNETDPVPEKPRGTEPTTEPEARQSADPETDKTELLNIALDYLAHADQSVRNGRGHIRASALRDELLKESSFRAAISASKMQPIPFIGQMFADRIRLYREKGFFWIEPLSDFPEKSPAIPPPAELPSEAEATDSPAPESDMADKQEIAGRKQNFYEQAYNNILQMFLESDFEQKVAEGITECAMQANAAENSREVFHTLLKQRFGDKMGIRYYRFAVRQLDLF